MLDIQNKRILYFDGFNDNGESAKQDVVLDFNNPKAGIFHKLNNNHSIYASYSIEIKNQIEMIMLRVQQTQDHSMKLFMI